MNSVIAIAVILASTLFIIRGIASVPQEQVAQVESAPIDMTNATLRETVAADSGIEDRIREKLSSQDDLSALSPRQFDLLVEQMGAVLEVRAGGAMDDYIALMESWGGRLTLPRADLEWIRKGWKPPGDPMSVEKFGLEDMDIIVSKGTEGATHIASRSGRSGLLIPSQFRFQSSPKELRAMSARQVTLTIPMKMNAGHVIEHQITLLWSVSDERWIPAHLNLSTNEGEAMPMTLF